MLFALGNECRNSPYGSLVADQEHLAVIAEHHLHGEEVPLIGERTDDVHGPRRSSPFQEVRLDPTYTEKGRRMSLGAGFGDLAPVRMDPVEFPLCDVTQALNWIPECLLCRWWDVGQRVEREATRDMQLDQRIDRLTWVACHGCHFRAMR